MKYKIALFILLSYCFSSLRAQTELISSHKLKWKGLEKWLADSTSINVISFDSASYPTDDRLPHFNKRIISDPLFNYSAVIKNPVFIPLSADENTMLNGNSSFSADLQILTNNQIGR